MTNRLSEIPLDKYDIALGEFLELLSPEEVIDVASENTFLSSPSRYRLLLEYAGFPIDGYIHNNTLLTHAIRHNYFNVASILIDLGADVNLCDTFHENTPLAWALIGYIRDLKGLSEDQLKDYYVLLNKIVDRKPELMSDGDNEEFLFNSIDKSESNSEGFKKLSQYIMNNKINESSYFEEFENMSSEQLVDYVYNTYDPQRVRDDDYRVLCALFMCGLDPNIIGYEKSKSFNGPLLRLLFTKYFIHPYKINKVLNIMKSSGLDGRIIEENYPPHWSDPISNVFIFFTDPNSEYENEYFSKTIEILLDCNFSVDGIIHYGVDANNTPLAIALKMGLTSIAKLLISKGADIDKTITIRNREIRIRDYMAEMGIPPNG